jgi:N6-adenosine-specific RNA methylase IME4
VADIRAHGLREPVVVLDGKILDSRNRYRACKEAGIECRIETYTGSDPVGYVVSLNLRRRHLNESQRAMVAAKLATLRRGDNQHSEGLPIGRSSELLNVGERSIARAREILDHGAPELQHAVERGDVSLAAAADVATIPQAEQRQIVARGEREILAAAKQIRADKVLAKRSAALAAQAQLIGRNLSLPMGERKYGAILADPPWPFETYSELGKGGGSVDNHYPTMTHAEIEALPVEALAADDCALFLWATMPQLPEALQVIAAWGFTYKTASFVWVKLTRDDERPAIGMGYWTRSNAEVCLLATRGNPHRLNADVHQIVQAPRMEHSRKPEEVAARIERLVCGPYIELFARTQRQGWDVWGNQAPQTETAA